METRARDELIGRLKLAIGPLLYRTGVADPDQPDGWMRLYLFRHEDPPLEFGERHQGGMLRSERNPKELRTRLEPYCPIPGDWLGKYAGFHAEGMVYEDPGGLRVVPFAAFTTPVLAELERRVAKIVRRGESCHGKDVPVQA